MEYGAFGRVNLIAASASIRTASPNRNEGRALTLRARQTSWIAVPKDKRQARLIVGEVLAEVFD